MPVALLLWCPPPRPNILLWSNRLQAAAIRTAGLAVTLAWTFVVAVARLCVFLLRIAWAYRHTAATPLLVASRHRYAAVVPLRLAHGAVTRLHMRLRPYLASLTFSLGGGLLAALLGWIIGRA